jgi:hypothetical protein
MGLATGLLIAGTVGAQLFGAHKQAKAAEKASTQQQQAGNRALDLQQQQYSQTRQDLTPYMQGGNQGLSALTSLLGVAPPPGAGAAPGGYGDKGLGLPPGFAPTGRPGEYAGTGQIGTPGPQAQRRPVVGNQSAYGAAPGMVLLRAPTGQTQAVPADQASFFLARGAQRV